MPNGNMETMTVINRGMWRNQISAVLENQYLKVTVLPELGGKSASIFYKERDFELLSQVQKGVYQKPAADTPFENCDASGFDDAFPTIVAAGEDWPDPKGRYTDHGEIWRSCFHDKIVEDTLELTYESSINNYKYKKTVSLHGSSVVYKYFVKNISNKDFPCLWAMHALVRYEEDMELFYPDKTAYFLNTLDSPELGPAGVRIPAKNGFYDFQRVPGKKTHTMVKYYVDGKVSAGRCGYRYPGQDVQCELLYDEQKLPYLGFWLTAGGFRGDYNCALEPSNGFYDGVSQARRNGALFLLKAGETLEFAIEIRLKRISQEKRGGYQDDRKRTAFVCAEWKKT